MKKISRFWFTGTAIALTGVIVARVLAPHLEPSISHSFYLVIKTLGHLVAFVGIFFIARGLSKGKDDGASDENNGNGTKT